MDYKLNNALRLFKHQKEMYESALYIKNLEGNSVGAFNSGIYAFFSGKKVINLDGVMNNNAAEAIMNYSLDKYILKERPNYIIDFEYTLHLYQNFSRKYYIETC